MTATFVRAEHQDTDPGASSHQMIPRKKPEGTQTQDTFAPARESSDHTAIAFGIIPRNHHLFYLGTETMTRARTEAPDNDPSGRQLQAIPK
jgi:hypothetical protein